MRSIVLSLIAVFTTSFLVASVEEFSVGDIVQTTPFRQIPFKWCITPRHDYSKVFVTKLFLAQAEFDKEYLGRYKLRDNGKQTVFMTCESALEAIKGMDAISLGLPKVVYLVGWQYNGHDSKYPAFFEGNKLIARKCDKDPLDSIRWLMAEAKKYNTNVSLHINLFDAFDDSPLFEEYKNADVLAKDKDGRYVIGDWGHKISYTAEWNKGLLQKRIDKLCSILPIAKTGTIHVDAFHNRAPIPVDVGGGRMAIRKITPISPWHGYTEKQDMDTKKKILSYFDAKGIDVTTEGFDMDIGAEGEGWFPMFWHCISMPKALKLNASQFCGGNVYGDQRLFGENVNAESVFRNNRNMAKALDVFKREFCKRTLICQYLNNFTRKAYIKGKQGCIAEFEGGVRTMLKNGRFFVEKDGNLLAADGNVFIPALWLGNGSIVAFSEKGCQNKEWVLPDGVAFGKDVKGWVIDASGRKPFTSFNIKGRKVTLSLEPGQMVLLCS